MELNYEDIRGAFGCKRMEETVLETINYVISSKDVSYLDNLFGNGVICRCTDEYCEFRSDQVMSILEKKGVLEKLSRMFN